MCYYIAQLWGLIMINDSQNRFQKLYRFTNENIAGYFPILNLKDKSVLTVGSSLDQAFNALVLGAKDVTVMDINPNINSFYQAKRQLVLTKSREKLYDSVLSITPTSSFGSTPACMKVRNFNIYLQSDEKYHLLCQRLVDNDIKIINGNIYQMTQAVGQKKYDRIIFSNALQYLQVSAGGNKQAMPYLKEHFQEWHEHLNDEGIIQLLYLYGVNQQFIDNPPKLIRQIPCWNVPEIKKTLAGYTLETKFFNRCDFQGNDAIVTYQKTKKY